MPEGPLGGPRLTNLGPFSRSTKEELTEKWDTCPKSGKEREICQSIKVATISILENQGFFTECKNLVDINSGFCGTVADQVADEVDNVSILQVGDGDHMWIEYNNKHYDAEVPTGVDDPFNLPFFKRIPLNVLLKIARMAAEAEDRELPETVEETIREVK